MPGDDAPRAFGLSRQEHILDELRRSGAVRVSELAQGFGVSELTVRRDIAALANRGLVTRVHGGATLRSRLDTSVPHGEPRASGALFRIGMVVPSLSYYWPSVIIGARAAASEAGAQIVLRGASYSVEDQRRQISSLLDAGGVHGLAVVPETTGPDGLALLQWLESARLPVVLMERRVPSTLALTSLQWAMTDHAFGGVLAADRLAALGHRRVGIVTSKGSPTSWHLRRGWASAIEHLGLACEVDVDTSLEPMNADEREALIGRVLEACRATGTTALLIHSDPQAVLLQQHALDHGWSIPGDLSIIAYDDEVAGSAEPAITALRPPKQEVGRVAVELLLRRLTAGAGAPTQRAQLLPVLFERDSTARLVDPISTLVRDRARP